MRGFTLKSSILVLVALFFVGCAGEGPVSVEPEDIDVRIRIVDELNSPFQPDRVWWYYGPLGREFDAVCINEMCTVFAVTGVLNATEIFIAANYRRPTDDPFCMYTAYDATRVAVVDGRTIDYTLQLVERLSCE